MVPLVIIDPSSLIDSLKVIVIVVEIDTLVVPFAGVTLLTVGAPSSLSVVDVVVVASEYPLFPDLGLSGFADRIRVGSRHSRSK